MLQPAISAILAFALFLMASPPSSRAASTLITDIEHWSHPTRAVFAKYGVTLDSVVLVDKTYPIFNVRLPKSAALQQQSGFQTFLQALAKANGYWSFTVQDGGRSAKATVSAAKRKLTDVDYSGMEAYFNPVSGRTITLAQAGLHPLPVSANKGALNAKIAALLKKPDQYSDQDYRSGLRMNYTSSSRLEPPVLLIDGRNKAPIIGKLKIGDAISSVQKTLGKPAYAADDTLFYKFGSYYAGFRGTTTIENATITATAPLKSPDLLCDVVLTLNATEDPFQLQDDPSLSRFFDAVGHIHGGGWYSESFVGLYVEEFEDRTITVYNDFTGKLLQPNENDSYEIDYVDEDSTVNRMRSVLGSYDYDNQRFKEGGVRSPGGKYIADYEWITSDSQYFTIRFADSSRPDFSLGARVLDDFYWVSDHYILYQDFITQVPYLLPVNPKKYSDNIDVLKSVGILFHDENYVYDIQITYVDAKSFGIKIDGKAYKIEYSLDAKGTIKLKLANNK